MGTKPEVTSNKGEVKQKLWSNHEAEALTFWKHEAEAEALAFSKHKAEADAYPPQPPTYDFQTFHKLEKN